ncbi:hypothetical protein V8C34DRAFT_286705 [Trichoderma compactum]
MKCGFIIWSFSFFFFWFLVGSSDGCTGERQSMMNCSGKLDDSIPNISLRMLSSGLSSHAESRQAKLSSSSARVLFWCRTRTRLF